ncbi:hypothetical protein Pyn_26372 [Prunus yedoensis var. nudiflora]|uniref:MADS-box domain-containing protein n=1 Tax=Prunus yedoensis var. nudiflora TaxID=2094558 RepID=A0A314YQL6_PRUYE|nr:hypothetical protein Pyn_26372 [Prunus yedoensis var. nudiflora]
MVMMKKKPSQGRQKIPIAKIAKSSNLQVTFCKRRSGLFKKASELCTLCGVEIAIVVFSPANKPFSFGHPHVESVLDRFLGTPKSSIDSDFTSQQGQDYMSGSSVHELNMVFTQTQNHLEAEKKRGQELDEMSKAGQGSSRRCWWENPIDEMGLHELEMMKAAMKELKKNVIKQVNKISMIQSCAAINSQYHSLDEW